MHQCLENVFFSRKSFVIWINSSYSLLSKAKIKLWELRPTVWRLRKKTRELYQWDNSYKETMDDPKLMDFSFNLKINIVNYSILLFSKVYFCTG